MERAAGDADLAATSAIAIPVSHGELGEPENY